MAIYKLLLPKMGESVSEATLTNWLKEVGDSIQEDEAVVEIATDKVDSDVPSPVKGILKEKLFDVNSVVQVGEVIALVEIEGEEQQSATDTKEEVEVQQEEAPSEFVDVENTTIPGVDLLEEKSASKSEDYNQSSKFFSPLVKKIAEEEGISVQELETIKGSGIEGRVTKDNVLAYLGNRTSQPSIKKEETATPVSSIPTPPPVKSAPVSVVKSMHGDEIIEMDRMRRLIADHMVQSVQTSPHVFSVVEADVTNLVNWRNKVKDDFKKREGENITFTPLFIEAISKAIKDFPMVNVSIDGYNIIKRKNINIGMAAALPSGNLIVPVIKSADQLSLVGISKSVNDLAQRARANKLKPDDTQGGTFTFTNIGAFGNIFGMPIINQPQAAIMAVGTIKKKPAVLETEQGDVIAIRHFMYISMSYDHRVIDGALGGTFIRRVADYLENWDVNRVI
ncbi:dihydrolipoamide acetyltransferase family protein [Sphingobacterium hungaricum]|uniref:Dihydrolipoamide acetyltransferase component of pyruvate dehydrogenase complex n=1 Tax=Sphingobacterium hungaricum TaxID=2082723 RepID=A0A928UTS4_9SPHI|nr:dihydrolipoamide acetyltransferase family protein [Sphingobacterium hungaricum]MBE8712733.1 diapophytoene dehydrogenase [Sphingobacterium hungaricum]